MLGSHPNPAEKWSNTIVAFESPNKLRDLSVPQQEAADKPNDSVEQQRFKIRLATSGERIESASMLIKKMYSWRGYETANSEEKPNRITLLSFLNDQVVGTCTLGLDSPEGFAADAAFPDKIKELRDTGCRIAEFTKLAVDQSIKSKRVLASLFHIGFIYSHSILKCTDVIIEVNPRHVLFYERMMGFKQFSDERTCGRVNAPAILLRLNLDYMDKQIRKFGGMLESADREKSLYPYFFSKTEEIGITNRLIHGE